MGFWQSTTVYPRGQWRINKPWRELYILTFPSAIRLLLFFFSWKAKCTHSWSIFKSINWISPRWHTDLQISHAGKMLSVMHFVLCTHTHTHTHTLAQTDAQKDVHIQAYIKPYANIVSISCLEMDIMALLWKQREEGGVQAGRHRDCRLSYVLLLLWKMSATRGHNSHMAGGDDVGWSNVSHTKLKAEI